MARKPHSIRSGMQLLTCGLHGIICVLNPERRILSVVTASAAYGMRLPRSVVAFN